jgi:hypothetical protein
VPITTYIAGIGASWESVGLRLLASALLLISGKQELGSRAPWGAVFWYFMAVVFGSSALVAAIRANLWSGAAICTAVLCLEILLIALWVLRRQSKTNSQ